MRQIITVATMKGGSGKSTVASCLGIHWQLAGRNPVIIDADPQRSISRLALRERALGGIEIIEDSSVEAWRTARKVAAAGRQVVIDTAGFRSETTLACIAAADFLLVPVKASPLDIDRMMDTLNSLLEAAGSRRPLYRCVLTQTTRDSVIAKHVRSELIEAGFPVLKTEMNNRVIYTEAALWGATPTLIEPAGAAAREIAAIAAEIDLLTGLQVAA
ncbi:MAG TPA: ParA family protein [Pseudolabrys sp.]|nr:ParA family protein [Pseudolabrys sp.]